MGSRTLPKLLQNILAWYNKRSKFPCQWTDSQLKTLVNYFSNVEVDSDFTSRVYGTWGLDEGCSDGSFRFSVETVHGVLQELREMFKVPKLQQLSPIGDTLRQNELIAGFLSFLLELLDPYPICVALIQFPTVEILVVKELRFLVTILGDTPFQATEHEQVQRILVEFKQIANEAGILVHSLTFCPGPVCKVAAGNAIGALLEHIQLLHSKIIKFLSLLPSTIISPNANGTVDSLIIVQSVVDDLEDAMINWDGNRLALMKEKIEMLHQWLRLSLCLLKDIKVPQLAEVEELKESIIQIRDMAFECDYLIKMDVPLWYLTIRLTHVTNTVKLVGTRLQEMKMSSYIVASKVVEDGSVRPLLKTKRDHGIEDIIVGFEEKEIEILDQLVKGREQLQIIFIVGMPGNGKTTLAKKLYNHPLTRYRFDKSVWCVISQMFQKKNLLFDIFNDLKNEVDKSDILKMDEECLAQEIYRSLKGKRYLVIMDDIWDSHVWEDLQRIFPNDGNGSRILFTSRNKDVAPCNGIIHDLPFLSNDQCWKLLENKVFCGQHCPSHLEEIGKEIAAKCYGLPLVVIVIAGILSTIGMGRSTWREVGDNLGSYMLSDQSNSVMQILELSYKHLPQHLKPCFLYFGVFPEDERVTVKKLKWLWIAEGFIHTEDQKGTERVAEEYLSELIDKSLVIIFQKRSQGGAKVCVIHDLLRDLCLRIAERENFLHVVNQSYLLWNRRYHRMSIQTDKFASYPVSVPYGQRFHTFSGSLSNFYACLNNMKLLKVLDCPQSYPMFGSNTPPNIAHAYLKFLAIGHVPRWVHNFMNLEFLIVDGYVDILIWKMVKLKYLCTSGTILRGTYKTNNLEYLSKFIIRNQNDTKIFRCSPHLRTLKCMCESSWTENGEYRCLDVHHLLQLESFTVESKVSNFVTEIKLPSNIKKLNLQGLHLPWEKMSMVGALPNLVTLKLNKNSFDGERWDTQDGEFQQLKFLKLNELDLHQWNLFSSQHFPKLQQLVFESCKYLEEIPAEIGEIATLELISIDRFCNRAIKECAGKIQQEREDMGDEELRVIIEDFEEQASNLIWSETDGGSSDGS